MALVLPLLLFVLFGLIDFGRMLNTQITLTEAAREGARAAVLALPNDQQKAADAKVKAAAGDGVTATLDPCSATNKDAVVSAATPFDFKTPLAALAPLFGGSMSSSTTLKGKGIMPCLG
jgi:Flp pilus assembly protein TadG